MVLASQPEGTPCRATLQASPCPLLMLQGIITLPFFWAWSSLAVWTQGWSTLLDSRVVKHCWTQGWSNTSGHGDGQTLLDTGVVKHCWTREQSNTAGHGDSQTLLDTETVKHCWTQGQSNTAGQPNTAGHRNGQTLLDTGTVKHCWTLGWSNTAGHRDGQTLLDMGMVTFTSLPHILLTYVASWSCLGVASASSDSCTYWG